MGTGISTDRRRATDVPVTPRRHTAEARLNFQETAQTARQEFGSTVSGSLVNHADGGSRTSSSTDATDDRLLTPEQMSRLGPPLLNRTKVEFGELRSSRTFNNELKFTADLRGIKPSDPLAETIAHRLNKTFSDQAHYYIKIKMKKCTGGTRISFRCTHHLHGYSARQAERIYDEVRKKFERSQALGFCDESDFYSVKSFYRFDMPEIWNGARSVLRDIVTKYNDSSDILHDQIRPFEEMAKIIGSLSAETRLKLLQAVLDLPGIDRADLFRSPKARFLLVDVAGWAELREPFEAIDRHYHEVWFKNLNLLDRKFKFEPDPETWRLKEVLSQSPDTPLSEKSIRRFLELAQAACLSGMEEEAIAVLNFLALRDELSEQQKHQVKVLRDQSEMVVRFSPDSKQAARSDQVKQQTDVAAISSETESGTEEWDRPGSLFKILRNPTRDELAELGVLRSRRRNF